MTTPGGFPGIQLRVSAPGKGDLLRGDSVFLHYIAALGETDADGWYHIVQHPDLNISIRACRLDLPREGD